MWAQGLGKSMSHIAAKLWHLHWPLFMMQLFMLLGAAAWNATMLYILPCCTQGSAGCHVCLAPAEQLQGAAGLP